MGAMPLLDAVNSCIHIISGVATATFKNLQLTSAFQPVFGLAHGRALGFEGLLRATDPHGTPVAPPAVFKMAQTTEELILLDALCQAVHTRNFARMTKDHWLFLNINPAVMSVNTRGSHQLLSSIISECGLHHNRIVVEVLEAALHRDISSSIDFYRALGCLIAVDDFGAGHSNLDRVWRMKPDIVKLDRILLGHTTEDRTSRMFLSRMVQTMHEAGSLVLLEGVETEAEAVVAMDSDVDLTQGFYFARPAPGLNFPSDAAQKFKLLYQQFHRVAVLESKDYRAEVAPYGQELKRAGMQMERGTPFYTAVQRFLELPCAERCYLLDNLGCQIGDSLLSHSSQSQLDPRFEPVTRAEGAYWGHRAYFRRAINRMGQVERTRPYLSVPTAKKCVTVSIAIKCNETIYVLCGDIMWSDSFSADMTLS
jgi:EAL domain-containing protein (putative c-di-GMP-specific phosphodiesterase class I)